MTSSSKQRRAEIKAKRRQKARERDPKARGPGLPVIPRGALPSDLSQLVHDNTYGPRPLFYVDRNFTCIDCGAEEVWTARQQKWWHEIAKGKIDSRAVRCQPCRRKHRAKARAARKAHVEGLVAKHGIAVAAERLKRTIEEVERMLASGHRVRRGPR